MTHSRMRRVEAKGLLLCGALATACFAQGPTFERNVGQFDPAILYAWRGAEAALLVVPGGFVVQHVDAPSDAYPRARENETPPARTARVRNVAFLFGDGEPSTDCEGVDLRGPPRTYLRRAGSPLRSDAFASVVMRGVVEGVDLVLRTTPDGVPEFDLEFAPGAETRAVAFRIEGADATLDARGGFRVGSGAEAFSIDAPIAWTIDARGDRRFVPCAPYRRADGAFAFVAPDRSPNERFVIDPILWIASAASAAFAPAFPLQFAGGVAVDPTGSSVVVGIATAPFAPTPGAFDVSWNGAWDVGVLRFAPGGALQWATFLGGALSDYPQDVAFDSLGRVVVCGVTQSVDFPATAGAWRTALGSPAGGVDGFLARLSPLGDSLDFATYLGGLADDVAHGVAIDATDRPAVVGFTSSFDYPATPGAAQTVYAGPGLSCDGFATLFLQDGSGVVWSTFFGGSDMDWIRDVAFAPSGALYVCGATNASDLATTPGAFDATFAGDDVFVASFAASNGALLAATFLGGTAYEVPHGIAVAPNGDVVVVGRTTGGDFPTTPGAVDATPVGEEGFVARLDAALSALVSSTFLGGSGADAARGVTVGLAGEAVVVGATDSLDFPITPRALVSGALGGATDAFVARVSPTGAALTSTYVGGPGVESCDAVAVDAAGVAYATGESSSAALVGASAPAARAIYLFALDAAPPPVAMYGYPTLGCPGSPIISTTGLPLIGAPFWATCSGASPFAQGLFGVSALPLAGPQPFFGAWLWIDLSDPGFFTLDATANAAGNSTIPLGIPPLPFLVGFQAFAQFAYLDPCFGVSTSAAIAVTVH